MKDKKLKKLFFRKEAIVRLNKGQLNLLIGGSPTNSRDCGGLPGTRQTTEVDPPIPTGS